MSQSTGQKSNYLIRFIVVSIAVAGYFIGLQSPMNPGLAAIADSTELDRIEPEVDDDQGPAGRVVPATGYALIGAVNRQSLQAYRSHLSELKSDVDRLAEFKVSPEQKAVALAQRELGRAFNGAPPTVPHPIDQLSTASCIVCHGDGAKSGLLRIAKMSHSFLANCTQCHVERSPVHAPAAQFGENSFVGLPAPTSGARAFEGAPPTIPHSTWMRVECMSCHGYSGAQGIRTTHPWRENCLQCHAPSAKLDQVQLEALPAFLKPLKIVQ